LVESYRMSPQRIQVVLNAVNIERFSDSVFKGINRLREELSIPPGARIILSASNLRPEKGISDLLAAMKLLNAKRPDIFLVVVGDGPEGEALKRQALAIDIDRSVRFIGSRSDLEALISLAELVVVPSVCQEAAPLTVIEGMAAARPVIATRVGGIPEYLIDTVTGFLVEPHSADQLASAIIRLLNSPGDAVLMGREGRMRVEAGFSMRRWIDETLAVYDEMLTPNRAVGMRR
jgi:glycosyltransferase involved in cell wall biosynthesis